MKRTVLALATTAALALSAPAHAQGVPTIDVSSIAKIAALISEAQLQLKEMIAQNLVLDEQTKQLIEQVSVLKQQLEALKNGLTLDALGINADFLTDILPPDYRNIIEAVKTGDMTKIIGHGTLDPARAGQLLDSFYTSVGLDKATVDTLSNSENPATARIATGAQAAAGLSLAAEASAEEAQEGLQRVDELVRKIPDTENLKQAIDLNTRVTAELAIAMANIWSMEAAQTISQGQMGVIDAATLADDEKFLDLSGEQ